MRSPVATLKPVVLALVVFCLQSSVCRGAALEVKNFRLSKLKQEQAVVTLTRLGTIEVRVHVKSPLNTAPVSLVLEGPDGILVEKEGASPLRLGYTLRNPERFGRWRATVTNTGKIPLLTGRLLVNFKPLETSSESTQAAAKKAPKGKKVEAPKEAMAAAAESGRRDSTDGKVTYPESREKLRAVCRGKNEGVFVRLDMEQGTGTYFMNYNSVFPLQPSYESPHVIRLQEDHKNPLYLDTRKNTLYFQGGEQGIFCKVRIYYGAN